MVFIDFLFAPNIDVRLKIVGNAGYLGLHLVRYLVQFFAEFRGGVASGITPHRVDGAGYLTAHGRNELADVVIAGVLSQSPQH